MVDESRFSLLHWYWAQCLFQCTVGVTGASTWSVNCGRKWSDCTAEEDLRSGKCPWELPWRLTLSLNSALALAFWPHSNRPSAFLHQPPCSSVAAHCLPCLSFEFSPVQLLLVSSPVTYSTADNRNSLSKLEINFFVASPFLICPQNENNSHGNLSIFADKLIECRRCGVNVHTDGQQLKCIAARFVAQTHSDSSTSHLYSVSGERNN